ncbi:MAG: gliding motility-associated C-terminal domain-containing protein [Bacteroidota bacterium]|nr:gliding motility-associated C-terminal domain-containing protein [Bacteroidota bacterium]
MIQLVNNRAVLSFWMVALLAVANAPVQAQVNFEESRTAKQILDSYDSFEKAVLNMTRDEWAVVREWEEFDEVRYLTVLREHKDSFTGKREELKQLRLQKIAQNEACGCWVEPDETYTTMVPPPGLGGLGPNEMAWANQGGAGWDVDCSSDPIAVSNQTDPWTFDLYGETYEFFYINSKGQISFGGDVIDWTPTGFPAAEYNQIAGYWQDTDIRTVGEIKWKKTQDAVYVNFIDVGYYNNQSDLTNSFQIIITSPESGILPDGNNAQVCYLDMNWAHGDVGGSGGCCGTDPGVTGADGESTNPQLDASPHVQFGRFNLLDDTYNGPYGIGEGNEDGINWLDYKFFNINTALLNNNLNPVPTANLGCDTISLCLGQTTSLNVEFLGPEPSQTVDLVINQNLAGECFIENESTTNGGTATFTGTFVAESPGISTVTMEATDSDGAVTTLDIVVNVLDIVPPSIDVTSATGEFGICAGSELDVTATSVDGQEPIEDWSWNLNPNFWDANEATIPFGGTFVVTGETAGGCVVKENFTVLQTPFYLPTVEGTLQAVCPGDSAFVEVIPDEDENFVGYTWVGDWNGGGGDVLSSDGAGAWLTAGVYQVTVEDEGGCEGKRTFILSPSASTIPDLTIDPLCGDAAFDTVTFEGGYASPAEGYIQLQLFSSINGWDGSFLNIDIIHPDGTTTNSTVTLPSGNFANVNDVPELAIVYGDSVEVTFVSNNPDNDQYLSFDMFNCVNNCISNPDACSSFNDLTTSVVFYGPALCEVQPALGTWEETSGLGNNSFSVTDQFNTTWSATEFGLYELCFNEEECGTATCYEVEVNEPPTIQIDGDSLVWACGDDDLELEVFITDPADVATINWPFPGDDNVLENEYSFDQYAAGTYVVTVENGCGEDADQVEYTAMPEPNLENDYLCGEGATIELDPIAGDQNSELVYEWTYNGNEVDDVNDNEWEVSETGSYCVTVPEGGCPSSFDNTDCAFIDIVTAIDIDVFLGGSITDCDGGGIEPGEDAVLGVNPAFIASYADYTVTWPDGTATTVDDNFEWIIPEESELNGTQICVSIEDPYGCEPQEACGLIFIGDDPTWDPLPVYNGVRSLCPGQPETFDLNADFNGPPYSNYSWTVQCTDTLVEFPFQNVADITGEMFPPSCWGYDLTLVASISNPCLPQGLQHEYDVKVEQCEILPPNVFTPRDGNDKNNGFHIMGLDPWEDDPEGVLVRIFDRWGNLVYENPEYRNATPWYGEKSADGVYFYTILLPNGDEFTGTVNIFRSR